MTSDQPQYAAPIPPAQYQPAPQPPSPQQDKKGRTISIVALSLAIAGTVFGVVKGALVIGWILLPIALIISIVALVTSTKKGLSISALIVSVVGTILAVVAFLGYAGQAVSEAFNSSPNVTVESGAPATDSADASTDNSTSGSYHLGDKLTTDDGLSITVAKPESYQPSRYAAGIDGAGQPMTFTITLENNSSTAYDPTFTYITASSGGVESAQIYDSGNGLSGYPTTSIVPGKSVTFKQAFMIQDPSDITLDVNLGFNSSFVLTN